MRNLSKSKALQLLRDFDDNGLKPLEHIVNDPNLKKDRKEEIEKRIKIYNDVIDTFQKITLAHIHFVLAIMVINKRLKDSGLIDENNKCHFAESTLLNEEFDELFEPFINLSKYYEVGKNGNIERTNHDTIVEFIDRLNDAGISVRVE